MWIKFRMNMCVLCAGAGQVEREMTRDEAREENGAG